MFAFLFKSTTYYLVVKKFRHQLMLLGLSLLAIMLIQGVYEDLYKVFKVTDKENLFSLLMLKWVLILSIMGVNIYKLKHVHLSAEEKKELFEDKEKEPYTPDVQTLIEKETLLSTTELILKKYTT